MSSSPGFDYIQSYRTSTTIAALFLVAACCAISLLVGCELFISFRAKGSQPESFVLLGGNALINISSSSLSSSSGTLQLLVEGSLQSICGHANNFSQFQITDSIPNLLSALLSLNHSVSFETSSAASFAKLKETLLVDLSPVLVQRDDASFALAVGYNQSGLLMVAAVAGSELKFEFVRSNQSARTILRNGIVIGCVDGKGKRRAQAGSAWPTSF